MYCATSWVPPTRPLVTWTDEVRPTWIEIDLAAIAANVASLCALSAPASVCAVVKADGYGHGAVEVARAAVNAGASMLAVATVEEGVQLRDAGVTGPVLVLSESPLGDLADVVGSDLTPTVYTAEGIDAVAATAEAAGTKRSVHLKVDTGMHRVGAQVGQILALAERAVAHPHIDLEGLFTHFAVADDPSDSYTDDQLRRFVEVVDSLKMAGVTPRLVHAANSAAAMSRADVRFDLVRCGIAIYGLAPSARTRGLIDLSPALSLRSRVSYVKRVRRGEALSYGRRYRLEVDSVVATVPVGYADGVRRRLGTAGGQVLIGGRRCPIAGTVTMDQIVVDCGPDSTVGPGDEVVLLGRQGGESIDADEWAERLGTITYEVVCGFGKRVPRTYVRGDGT